MDEDTINDLKQFIAVTFSQQAAELRKEIVTELHADMQRLDDKLSGKIDELSAAVAEALSASDDVIGVQLNDHERRLTRLEKYSKRGSAGLLRPT